MHPTLSRPLRRLASLAVIAAVACSPGGAEEGSRAADAGADAPATYTPGPPLANPRASSGSASAGAPPAADSPSARSGGTDMDALGFTRGAADAPVRVVEFSDFGCGYCRKFHEESWPRLERDYVATGKVQWKMVPFDVGLFPHARQAVLAGECAGEQDRFEPMRERLFAVQSEWKGGSAAEALATFRRLAQEEGLDTDRFGRCLAQGWRAERVNASNAVARQLGIRGTPTFYILGFGIIPGALPADEFASILDRVLAMEAAENGS